MADQDMVAHETATDSVRKAFEELNREPEATEPTTEAAEGTTETEVAPDDVKDDRTRDEKGRFAKADKEEDEKSPFKAEAEEEAPKEEPKPEPVAPPVHFKGAAKVRWEKLPRDVQEEIVRTLDRQHESVTKYQGMEQVLAPRRSALVAQYGSEAQAVQSLFALSDFAAQQPLGFIKWFAQQRGVDLNALAPKAQEAGETQQGLDPALQAIVSEVSGLKQMFAQHQTTTRQAQDQAVANEVNAFIANPKYPYANELRSDMAQLMAAGIASSLEDAYEKATRMNTSVWGQIQAAQTAEKAEVKRQENARKKAAGGSIAGAPGVSVPPAQQAPRNETARESVQRAWNQLNAGDRA